MNEQKIKAEIKSLYKKDRKLAKKVAAALGFKIIRALKMQNVGLDPKGAPIPKVKEGTAKKVAVPNQVQSPKVKMGKHQEKTRK